MSGIPLLSHDKETLTLALASLNPNPYVRSPMFVGYIRSYNNVYTTGAEQKTQPESNQAHEQRVKHHSVTEKKVEQGVPREVYLDLIHPKLRTKHHINVLCACVSRPSHSICDGNIYYRYIRGFRWNVLTDETSRRHDRHQLVDIMSRNFLRTPVRNGFLC